MRNHIGNAVSKDYQPFQASFSAGKYLRERAFKIYKQAYMYTPI